VGQFMKQDDYFIEPLLDILNMRFAPGPAIREMATLQKRFGIFKIGRSFRDSVRIINAISEDRRANQRWLRLLGWLRQVGSDSDQNGSERIVSALVENLEARAPKPVHFTYHVSTKSNAQVRITPNIAAVSFMRDRFLTISIPLIPK